MIDDKLLDLVESRLQEKFAIFNGTSVEQYSRAMLWLKISKLIDTVERLIVKRESDK